jgi:hypothetical protein
MLSGVPSSKRWVVRIGIVALTVVALGFGVVAGCGGEPGTNAAATVTVTEQASATVPAADQVSSANASAEAEVVVDEAGFSQADQSVGYGLVLENRSKSDDATDVELTINLVNKGGVIVGTETEYINVIPAGERYYAGGTSYLSGDDQAQRIEPSVAVGSSAAAAYKLAPVSNVRFSPIEYSDGIEVVGQVRNDYSQPLSSFAKIGVVAFDDAGRVVGGGFTFLDADLQPGRSASFSMSSYEIDASKVSRVEATVDNEVT